ncbi:hypothetical protein [Streptomyces sp. NPDC101776]|uniref:hypothetical protein n=1 Tax=Streptomyces sp. NPDC101776 TaxID=3366146 RepID=UPI00382F91DF
MTTLGFELGRRSGHGMSADLERCGVLAQHVAQLARMRFPERVVPRDLGRTLLEMGRLAQRLAAAHLAHTEIRLTPDGPVIIEVNGRLADDFVPHLAKPVTGLDGAIIATRVACGEPPLVERAVRRSAAHQIVYADQNGTFNAAALPSQDHHPDLMAIRTLLPTGRAVALPPRGYMARLGYAIVTAPSADESVGITPSR